MVEPALAVSLSKATALVSPVTAALCTPLCDPNHRAESLVQSRSNVLISQMGCLSACWNLRFLQAIFSALPRRYFINSAPALSV